MAIIEKMNGERYNLSDYGFPSLNVYPIDIVYDSENITGRAGRNRVISYHGVRKIQLQLSLQANDVTDTILLRDELAGILDDVEEFYIYESISQTYKFEYPGQTRNKSAMDAIEWVPMLYKRWKVERISNSGIEWDGLSGKKVVEFETSDLPYAVTPFTSTDLSGIPLEWDADEIAWGMGFDWDEDAPTYSFSSNNFTVKNYGNVDVNPRYMPLKITLRGTFNNNVTIKNVTTNETFVYNGNLTSGQTLVLDGVNFLKNNSSITGNTNKNLIKLKKGENQFQVTGGTVTNIQFDFPFYYL